MVYFFGTSSKRIVAVSSAHEFSADTFQKLEWLLEASQLNEKDIPQQTYVGPRASMLTPWSTNAVEITQNMGVEGIDRMEEFFLLEEGVVFDPMVHEKFEGLHQHIFDIDRTPESVLLINDITQYNEEQGLALSSDEIAYLEGLSQKLGRLLTDSEVFGFSQVNSEHCRHKIFNGTFEIDGQKEEKSLFQWIKATSQANDHNLVSAYKDNVAFITGPEIEQFAPSDPTQPSAYTTREHSSVISLKAETHNFPTTVEPFSGAATGSGGEIRDRLAGGQGSLPLAGTAVYMTPYPRLNQQAHFPEHQEHPWLYQRPLDILIKASNGASDFGNKFGQPLIAGSLLTFEHQESDRRWGYDKTIMLAGGIGYTHTQQAQKKSVRAGDLIVILGGDNYRIGMGGAAVSSADTGNFESRIELNAVQRSNPEMQKRVANTVRALVEKTDNPIRSIHDHGAGGHLNCLSELVEESGGKIHLDKLPVGDPTLSAKEIMGNESQERMGLVIAPEDLPVLEQIAARERSPLFVVGEVTADERFVVASEKNQQKPIDLDLNDFFGNPPKMLMSDQQSAVAFEAITTHDIDLKNSLSQVFSLESVGAKDWLTNKVDRCVTGRVAQQQTVGEIQLPLSNFGMMALDYKGHNAIATSIGHAPVVGLINPQRASEMAIARSLTNIIFAPLEKGLAGVSLSANWMWACNNPGEDARLYTAVKACAEYAIALGINIPTGKDSLSMKQKYADFEVQAPGTVIISAAAHVHRLQQKVTPVIDPDGGDLYYINLSNNDFALGGSALGQTLNKVGQKAPEIAEASYVKKVFNWVQEQILSDHITAGHDVAAGGLITSLMEMSFATSKGGWELDLSQLGGENFIQLAFSEACGIILQSSAPLDQWATAKNISCQRLGKVNASGQLKLIYKGESHTWQMTDLRDQWFYTSTRLEKHQTPTDLAEERFQNFKHQPLQFKFPQAFNGKLNTAGQGRKIKAGVLREKGSNSEREMAYALHLCGFEVIDIHMTDLISGRTQLEDIQFLAAVGGFSNSDVLGSAKGWAGAIRYNPKAKAALDKFFSRSDTLSLGVCNGCQLFVELNVLYPEAQHPPRMAHNESGKFECHFTGVQIHPSPSIMLKPLEGSTLGIWAAHGEGKFELGENAENFIIPSTYQYDSYPGNPNGSDANAAMLCSADGRHLVMMPHLERATFPWNWAHYPTDRKTDEVSPWLLAFKAAYEWLKEH